MVSPTYIPSGAKHYYKYNSYVIEKRQAHHYIRNLKKGRRNIPRPFFNDFVIP